MNPIEDVRAGKLAIQQATGSPPTEVALMLVVGSLAGAGVALSLTGLAGKMLFGITATQPAVFASSAAVLALAALAAGWLPVRRASRVNPMVALRHQ